MISQTFLVTSHTNHITSGSTFVVIRGMKEDGVAYIPLAIQKGASTIVVQEDTILTSELINFIEQSGVQLVYVPNTRQALAQLSAQAYNFPAQKLSIIGVTGTKGKSTTTFLLEHIFKTAGYKTALLSTVKNRILDTDLPTQLTTQQPDYLHAFFQACVQQGVTHVILEVAAQALTLHRVQTIEFDAALITNFSQEHAEFYPSLDDYFNAKKNIINQLKAGAPLILNSDDKRVRELGDYINSIFFGLESLTDFSGTIVHNNLAGLTLDIYHTDGQTRVACPALVGAFNAYNILAAVTLARSLLISWEVIRSALLSFTAVPGRLDKYLLPNGATAFIDYAHNPSSYEAVLSTLRAFTPHLIVVFGAGGERDATKRPLMGAIASQYADAIILTSDNPRSEDPAEIINNIQAGIHEHDSFKVSVELDRARAIQKAYELSRAGSIIVLLGKGPEEYQLIKGIKYPLSERAILQSL